MKEASNHSHNWERALESENSALMKSTLEWMWAAFVEKVLEALEISEPFATHETKPRIWWIPTGPLTTLPIHAALEFGEAEEQTCLIDWVVSSYATTIRGQLHSSRPRSPVRADSPNVVSVGVFNISEALLDTPLAPFLDYPLGGAEQEALEISQIYQTDPILSANASVVNIGSLLSEANILHVACHGMVDLVDPTLSGIVLYDGVLSARELAIHELENLDLVFLSACETADLGARVVDEAISIATAFQLAGSRNTIGTLWPIGDLAGYLFAKPFHERLHANLQEDRQQSIASLLNAALRSERSAFPNNPSRWAAYIHYGV
jgi:CHAT domain-containing protein